ncbi:hypothetical protein JMJ35_003844 [Cladonia borealis]|uniref:DUF7730 domain-containing protein n=1 Tax=Cladonia borealis TaxID=184061 RepID=A0AA39V371_9LECA|nr:hypothetical protein JMJ35_003844 [Cladonia borealis]
MSDTKSLIPAPTPTCPLLVLPPEIRNRIWTLAVVDVEEVIIRCNRSREPSDKHLSPTTMSLASTCRRIYREVTPFYYSENLFHFHHGTIGILREFAAAIGPANAKSITAVEIPIYPHIMHISRRQLEGLWPFPNLKTLVYYEKPEIYGHYRDELHLPRPSHTVAVFRKSRTGDRVEQLPSWYDFVIM